MFFIAKYNLESLLKASKCAYRIIFYWVKFACREWNKYTYFKEWSKYARYITEIKTKLLLSSIKGQGVELSFAIIFVAVTLNNEPQYGGGQWGPLSIQLYRDK